MARSKRRKVDGRHHSTGFFPWCLLLQGSEGDFEMKWAIPLKLYTLVLHVVKGPCVVKAVKKMTFILRPVTLRKLEPGDVARFKQSGQLRVVDGKPVHANLVIVG